MYTALEKTAGHRREDFPGVLNNDKDCLDKSIRSCVLFQSSMQPNEMISISVRLKIGYLLF